MQRRFQVEQHADAMAATAHRTSWSRLGVLAALLCAFALRLYQLGGESLWYDETVSAFLAQQRIPDLLAHTAGDIHPPGYYLLLHFWQAIITPPPAASFEFLYGWPSLCFGMLIVALLYPIGKRLMTGQVALLALWLAAVHPLQIWYSQEVRMYTLGAALGLFALWALLQALAPPSTEHSLRAKRQMLPWLRLYTLCAAAGLYTLYYFLFLLIALNMIALYLLLHQAPLARFLRNRSAYHWLAAQCGVLLLWLPWLPIFWRQVTDPPVPPWRVPWPDWAALIASISESVSTLLSGQSAPLPTHWAWAFVGLLLLFGGFLGGSKRTRDGKWIILIYSLLPITILFGITLVATPIYHVRYLMLYAPLFVLWSASVLITLYQRNRSAGIMVSLLLLFLNGWSLVTFWRTTNFQSDDHRTAVSRLAAQWRPGDLILVNAGWVYTAVELYWPTQLIGPTATLPPPIREVDRLLDFAQLTEQATDGPVAPMIIRGGSVDGPANLGWGAAESDFFAIDRSTTIAALEALRRRYQRLWHYRLYDTVSDPAAVVRQWLDEHATLVSDEAIPGRDYLRLQLYAFPANAVADQTDQTGDAAPGHDAPQRGPLALIDVLPSAATISAGSTLYFQTSWQWSGATSEGALSLSLRLYDSRGLLVAQQDSSPSLLNESISAGKPMRFSLALPLPVAIQPGSYTAQLLLYEAATGAPLHDERAPTTDPLLTLGELTITPPAQPPIIEQRLVAFDYIDLIAFHSGATEVNTTDQLALETIWLPNASTYRDTYLLRWRLIDDTGLIAQEWEEPMGSWDYPSGSWPANLPVRQQTALPLEADLAGGYYQLRLQVVRNSDHSPIKPVMPLWQTLAEGGKWQINDTDLILARLVIDASAR